MKRPATFPDVPQVVRQRMARIRSSGTRPEMVVRKAAHALGYRFRLNRRDLPGSPDLVFPSRRKVVFVHGCFWHRHSCKTARRVPVTRQEYWAPKLRRNVERDHIAQVALCDLGWDALTIWECETGDAVALNARLTEFLGPPGPKRIDLSEEHSGSGTPR